MIGRREEGQALFEFALVIPLVLLLFMGILDLGRGAYAQNAVSNAAREGMRTAIVNQTVASIRSQAAAQATGIGIDATATGCTAGTATTPAKPTGTTGVCVEFRSADLATTCTTITTQCIAVVTVKYTFNALTPGISGLVGPLDLFATSQQGVEALCVDPAIPACPLP
jgi:Flp pilus assembly protein TadG